MDRARRFTRPGAERPAFAPIVGSGPERGAAAPPPGRPADRRGETADRRLRRAARRLLLGLHAHVRDRAAPGRARDGLRSRAWTHRRKRSPRCARRRGARGRRDRARPDRRRPASRSSTGSATASGSRSTSFPASPTASDAVLEPGNVVTVEPGVYLAGRGGVRIEDLVIVGDGGPEVLTPFTKELRQSVEVPLPARARDRARARAAARIQPRGRDDLHEPVQERHARRARRAGLAHRRVPAREARQGRRVRPHEAQERSSPAPSSTARSGPARRCRASTRRRRTSSTSTTRATRSSSWTRRRTSRSTFPRGEVADELQFLQPSSSVSS